MTDKEGGRKDMKAGNVCYIYDSMYGGYYAEVMEYDGAGGVNRIMTIRDDMVATLKELVKNKVPNVRFKRVHGECTIF